MRLQFFLAAALAALSLRAQPNAACNNTPVWSPCELTFELSEKDAAAHPNPYVSVELKADVRSPRQRTIAIPAYWDGGRKFVIRLTPTEPGQWEYQLTSNIADWNGKIGAFTAADSDSPGFILAANMHHWAYPVRLTTEIQKAHLWMGASEPRFAFEDDASFRAVGDARAAQKFTHLRGYITGPGPDAAYSAPDTPNLEQFRKLDERVRYLNQKGIIADLVLAGGSGTLTKLFPQTAQRRRFARYVVARYAAMNITWQLVDDFEDYPDARAMLKDLGLAIKEFDGYQHPRSTGARVTSAPLLDDGWMDYVAYGTGDDNVGAIEHQLYATPFVNLRFAREDSGAGKTAPDDVDEKTFRRRLWNATMDGQYVTYANTGSGAQYVNSPGAKAMTVWFDTLSGTRHWELEPYFDVDGGRALALEGTEYLVYIERPGPLELTVEKHGYDVFWTDPATGEITRRKFSGDHFTGSPPDLSHDWVLHVVREGQLQSMSKSYKFSSREDDIQLQEIELNPPKIPFDVTQTQGDLSVSKPSPYTLTLKRATRATRTMMYLWTGEVTAEHQGYRVLATGAQGTLQPTSRLAVNYPATLLLRVYGMNANGKVYMLAKVVNLNP
jgi:hypothetical protein